MPILVPGTTLPLFADTANVRHEITGPGPDAYKLIAGTDHATYLISPGVLDCAILTIFLPPSPGQISFMSGHRAMGARAMVHYNPFSGPLAGVIKALFDAFLTAYAVGADQLTVSILFNSGARRPYTNTLFGIVNTVVPTLGVVTSHGYGAPSSQGQLTKPVTIYMSPDGQLSASQ